PLWHYFGRSTPTDDQLERFARVRPANGLHGPWADGRAVGGAGAFPFELTVPGGRVPAAGVSVVGVLPTHRRRGILAALMRAQLDACHERGEPVTYLWATEDTIYGRFGYGIGSFAGAVDRGIQTGTVDVVEAMGDSPEATRAIWRYLLDVDWMARVRAGLLPLDHPLLLLLAEPRRLRFNVRDGLWVRLVDVGAALTARSY